MILESREAFADAGIELFEVSHLLLVHDAVIFFCSLHVNCESQPYSSISHEVSMLESLFCVYDDPVGTLQDDPRESAGVPVGNVAMYHAMRDHTVEA